jgi:putative peptidoglycan lipid II flippase
MSGKESREPPVSMRADSDGRLGASDNAAEAAAIDGEVGPASLVSHVPGSVRKVVGKAALVILAATLVGRLLGLVRDQATAYFFGARSATDAYFLASKIPYLLVVMVSGALVATFVPLLTFRISTGRKREAWDLAVNLGNVIFLVLVAATVVLVIVAPWLVPLVGFGIPKATANQAVFLFRILMIGFVFDAMAGMVSGMLNSIKRFALAAFAPAIGTLATVVVLVALARPLNITSLAMGSVLGSFIGFVAMLGGLRDQKIRYRPRIDWTDSGIREVAGMVWPVMLGSAMGTIAIFSDQIMASFLESGSVSSLSYADKIFQLPLALFVMGITVPIFPLISEQVALRAEERVKATVSFALRVMGFLLLPTTVAIILLRAPIVGAIYQHGRFDSAATSRTAWVLLFETLGLYTYAGRNLLTQVFYSHHDTKTPVKIAVGCIVLNIGISYLLMRQLGVGGLTLGTSIAVTVNFVVLIWFIQRRLRLSVGFSPILLSLLPIAAASAGMGVVIWVIDAQLARHLAATAGGFVARVCVGVVVGSLVFIFLSWIARVPELRESVDMLKSVFRRLERPQRDT